MGIMDLAAPGAAFLPLRLQHLFEALQISTYPVPCLVLVLGFVHRLRGGCRSQIHRQFNARLTVAYRMKADAPMITWITYVSP